MATAIQFDLSVVVGVSNPPAGSQPESFYTENQFTSLTGNTTTNTYTFNCYEVIMGTGISVTEVTGNMTYEELVAGIRNNATPYFFQDLSIYANSIDQANEPIVKVLRGVAGNSRKLIDNPTITPTQNQFVILNEPISLAPKTINQIDYTVKAGESVQLIFNYTKGNLNAIAEVIDTYIQKGVPFSKSLKQLEVEVSKDHEEYLRDTLRATWERKKKELLLNESQLNLDKIFESNEETKIRHEKELGKTSMQVRKILEEQQLKKLQVDELQGSNIKKLVANYVAKGKADELNDEYNYFDED